MSNEEDIKEVKEELKKETDKLREIERKCEIKINSQKLRVASLRYDLKKLKED